MFDDFSFVRRISLIGTILATRLTGVCVGQDSFGNRYYRSRRVRAGRREKRWVFYAGEPEASMVPPDWFGWLHHSCDQPLPNDPESRYVWLRPHQPNLSGTEAAPLPSGHPSVCQARCSRGRVQAWFPPLDEL
ncbi:MAG: NADH-ubiquinone oxidoreductase subunit NDUFA12 family protein [Bdellovibrionales bacterium]